MKAKADLFDTVIFRVYNNRVIASGKIYNDELNRFADATLVDTSSVEVINLRDMTVETRNTLYKLHGKTTIRGIDKV